MLKTKLLSSSSTERHRPLRLELLPARFDQAQLALHVLMPSDLRCVGPRPKESGNGDPVDGDRGSGVREVDLTARECLADDMLELLGDSLDILVLGVLVFVEVEFGFSLVGDVILYSSYSPLGLLGACMHFFARCATNPEGGLSPSK